MSTARNKRGFLPCPAEVLEKLEKTVNEGNHYGAQKMYKSYSVRYTSAEKYTEALEILQSGALIQLNNKQVTCGAELAVLFVETLIKIVSGRSESFAKLSVPQHLGDDDFNMEKL